MRLLVGLCVIFLVAGSCVKKCRVAGCLSIQDHTHYAGGERGDGRPVSREEALKDGKQLRVVSGMPWYRRMFRKSYRTENNLQFKRFDYEQSRAKNKQDYHKWSGRAKYPSSHDAKTSK